MDIFDQFYTYVGVLENEIKRLKNSLTIL